jgi:hypothetical protein
VWTLTDTTTGSVCVCVCVCPVTTDIAMHRFTSICGLTTVSPVINVGRDVLSVVVSLLCVVMVIVLICSYGSGSMLYVVMVSIESSVVIMSILSTAVVSGAVVGKASMLSF